MSRRAQYAGRAGHLAAMAELLLRGWNVAIPEVDVGDDIFVVRDATRTLKCVQVKTSLGPASGLQFKVSLRQIQSVGLDPLAFVFVTRVASRWCFLVFGRKELEDLYSQRACGTLIAKTGEVLFRVKVAPDLTLVTGGGRRSGTARGESVDLRPWLAAWDAELPEVLEP